MQVIADDGVTKRFTTQGMCVVVDRKQNEHLMAYSNRYQTLSVLEFHNYIKAFLCVCVFVCVHMQMSHLYNYLNSKTDKV